MSPGRRPLRFDLISFLMGFLVIGGMYAVVVFLLWLAFHDSAPPIGCLTAFP
jgi:hypothetical protein